MTRLLEKLLLTATLITVAGCSKPSLTFKADNLAGLENPSIHILTDRSADIPTTGSFGWGHCLFKVEPGPELNLSRIDERLRHALRTTLSRQGLTFAATEPDLLVSYALASGAAINDEELNQAYGARLEMPPRDPQSALHYKRGVLIVDVVSRQSKHLLWRGAILAEIDPAWPEERKQERCDAAVGALFRHFPTP